MRHQDVTSPDDENEKRYDGHRIKMHSVEIYHKAQRAKNNHRTTTRTKRKTRSVGTLTSVHVCRRAVACSSSHARSVVLIVVLVCGHTCVCVVVCSFSVSFVFPFPCSFFPWSFSFPFLFSLSALIDGARTRRKCAHTHNVAMLLQRGDAPTPLLTLPHHHAITRTIHLFIASLSVSWCLSVSYARHEPRDMTHTCRTIALSRAGAHARHCAQCRCYQHALALTLYHPVRRCVAVRVLCARNACKQLCAALEHACMRSGEAEERDRERSIYIDACRSRTSVRNS